MRHHPVAAIVAETSRFKEFKSAKQLTSYAGYDIVHNESGTSVLSKTRISKKGNRYMRHHMHMPAWSASNTFEFKALKERIKAKTGIPMKAQVAVQRKLLILMHTSGKTTWSMRRTTTKKGSRNNAQATQDSALQQLPLEV
ncbi:MAG: IS110 family transposase [Flavobacteriales bacterium]|nr:IS110 family transposase [Flavobacteriales bacterium]